MTSKTHLNSAMEALENAVIRQAESMGMNPGSDEFEQLVRTRIIEPERKSMTHLRGKSSCVHADVFLSNIDNKWVHQKLLRSLLHWCRVNAGIHITTAAHILGYNEYRLRELGEQCLSAGIGPDFSKMLNGMDDTAKHAFHPELLNEGHRGSKGFVGAR